MGGRSTPIAPHGLAVIGCAPRRASCSKGAPRGALPLTQTDTGAPSPNAVSTGKMSENDWSVTGWPLLTVNTEWTTILLKRVLP